DVIDLAHLIVLGHVRRARDLAAIDDADVDIRLSDVERAHLLIDDGVLRAREVPLDLFDADVRRRTAVARRLRPVLHPSGRRPPARDSGLRLRDDAERDDGGERYGFRGHTTP